MPAMSNKRSTSSLSSANVKSVKTQSLEPIAADIAAAVRVLLENGVDNDSIWSLEVFFVDQRTNKEVPQNDSTTGADDIAQVLAGKAKWVLAMEEHADEIEDYDDASDQRKIRVGIKSGHVIDRASILSAWSKIINDDEYSEIKVKVVPRKHSHNKKSDNSDEEDEQEFNDVDGSDCDQFVQLCAFGKVLYG